MGIADGGAVYTAAGQAIYTRVLHVARLPLLPLGTRFVVHSGFETRKAYSLPFFSTLGMASAFLAFARAWLFMLGVIFVIAAFGDHARVRLGYLAVALVVLAIWGLCMWLGKPSPEQRYEQTLLGLATGVAALPQWLEDADRRAIATELERRWTHFTQRPFADVRTCIEGREGDARAAVLAYAVARYTVLRDAQWAPLVPRARAWARASMPPARLEREAVGADGSIRMLGVNDKLADQGLRLDGRPAFLNPQGTLATASLLLISTENLELAVRDKDGVALALRQMQDGAPSRAALGDQRTVIALKDLISVEASASSKDVILTYRQNREDEVLWYSAVDGDQREAVLAALRSVLGESFVEKEALESKVGVLIRAAMGFAATALIGMFVWHLSLGRIAAIIALTALVWWVVQRLRTPVFVKTLSRKPATRQLTR